MLQKSELKEGEFVWWTRADEWSCPCVVTKVHQNFFRVRSLDDFKETGNLRMDDQEDKTSRHEMRLCSREEVEDFFVSQKEKLQALVDQSQRNLDAAISKRDNYEKRAKKLLG